MRPLAATTGVTVAVALALGTGMRAPAVALDTVSAAPAALNGEVFDPAAPPKPRYEVLPHLLLGASLDVDVDSELNYDLDDDRLIAIEPVPQAVVSYSPLPWLTAFGNLALVKEFAPDEHDDKDRPWKLELRQLNLAANQVIPYLNVRIGRTRFKDAREWLFDKELDALVCVYGVPSLYLDASLSRRNLVDRDLLNGEDHELINNYFLTGRWVPADAADLSTYVLFRDGERTTEDRPVFIGARAMGEPVRKLNYWLDVAYVTGEGEEDRKTSQRPHLRGIGLDTGATYVFRTKLRPSITLGYAFGSGDREPDDGRDANFRQTGLQGNADKFNGVTRFEYYGVVMQPELSNLHLATAGVGVRLLRRTSVDLVYHHYAQDVAVDDLRDTDLETDPTGDSKTLGNAIDLVIGFQQVTDLTLTLAVGAFLPGRAFPNGSDPAVLVAFESRYIF